MGQVHGAMAAIPHLKRHGGALIHISSMGAKRGVPLQTAYCASKHGIDGFVETLRMEVRREDLPISVTAPCSGTLSSDGFRWWPMRSRWRGSSSSPWSGSRAAPGYSLLCPRMKS
jgi:NAD(P)-dependent dehydrogenase (short-subunit alcohol dehydrogenase family)